MPLPDLLDGILDYAGLFPPARLGMAEAVDSYLRFTEGPEAWLVDKFLCPADRLQELARELDGKGLEGFPVGVIGSGGADYDAFTSGLEADAKAMTWFQEYAEIHAYETKLPGDAAVDAVAADLRGFDAIDVFLELPWGPGQSDLIASIAATEWMGAKARTGGLEAAAYPSSEALAGFLKDAQDLDVPFKLTAGLHEPLRHFEKGAGVWHHGFLNILTALAMNETYDFSRGEMAAILDAETLEFPGGSFTFNGEKADGEGVREVFIGFGSCSAEEPIAGLKRLGISEGGLR